MFFMSTSNSSENRFDTFTCVITAGTGTDWNSKNITKCMARVYKPKSSYMYAGTWTIEYASL